MRKFYSFLIAALLMPVLAFAQDNKAISVTQVDPYQKTDNMLEIPYVGLIEDKIPASREICYSVGFWIKPAATLGTSGQFKTAEGTNMGLLFGFGTNEHTNPGQLQFGLGYDSDGKIQIIGDGGLGATSNGFAPNPNVILDSIGTQDWSYIMFTIDNVNLKAAVYVNGECKREADIMNPGMYWPAADSREGGDNGKWPTFHWFSYRAQGALDEVQFFSKALSAAEVREAMKSAYTNGSLIALYDLNEEKSTGTFGNVAPGGKAIDAVYKKVQYGAYWAGSALVNRSGSTPQTPTYVEGRNIEIKDVTLEIPQTEGGSVVLTAEDGTQLTTGSHTVKTQDTYTVAATAADGYAIRRIYNEVAGNAVPIENNSKIVMVADAKVYGSFSNDFVKLNVNCGEGAEYAMTRYGNEAEAIDKLINGEPYDFTVSIVNPEMKLVEVKLNGEVLEAVNGVYSFTAAAGQTLDIVTTGKDYYTLTVVQPEAGGIVTVMNGDVALENGSKIRERDVLTLVATPEAEHWIRTSWIVNGELYEPSTVTVTGDLSVSVTFVEGVATCMPQPRDGISTTTSKSDRYVTSIEVSDGTNNITLNGSRSVPREIYIDQRTKVLETTPGTEITFVTEGAGIWMHTAIWADFDFNGFTNDDYVFVNPGNHSEDYAGTRKFTVPISAKEHPYTVRYMVDWDRDDPCLYGQAGNDNGDYVTDFILYVKQPRIETARNITIAPNNSEFGKVEFLNVDADGNTVNTNIETVVVKATSLKEDIVFINWTDGNGVVLSTDAEFAYKGSEDVELIANFGYPVTYTYDTELGALSVTNNGEFILNGNGVPAGESIVVEAIPNPGYEVTSFTVNGAAVTENPVTITVDQPINIEVVFAKADYKMNISWNGNGSVRVADDIDDNELPTGTEYKNGDVLVLDAALMIWVIPGEGETIKSATVTNGDETYSLEDFEPLSNEIDYLLSVSVAGSINATAEFTGEGSAIDGIEADDANAPVEFYNLQGVRVNSENLVPGIYVRRQGSKAVKVYVTK